MEQSSSVSINSKHYIDKLENDIVQLARVLSVEYTINIEDAKIMARQITQRRINQLLTKEEKEGISKIKDNVTKSIKNGESKLDNPKDIYELLKTFDLL
jgi:uncharacterized protein YehS (DUF1456 family)